MLILKLIVVPSFLLLVSQAARKWGPRIGGLLGGFPVVAGPILAFIALEHGAEFASQAAQGSLLAVIGTVAFGIVFSRSCTHFGWLISALLAFAAWGVVALAASHFSLGLLAATVITLAIVSLAPLGLPKPGKTVLLPKTRDTSLPTSELAARMIAEAILTLAVSAIAEGLGTRWAGLLAMFPVLSSVLGVFSLRANGPAFVTQLFRGLFLGFYAFCLFCIFLSYSLTKTTITLAFFGAIVLAMVAQLLVFFATMKR